MVRASAGVSHRLTTTDGDGAITVSLLTDADTEGYLVRFRISGDDKTWTVTKSTDHSSVKDTKPGSVPEGTRWVLEFEDEVKIEITQGETAFDDYDFFSFSVFKSERTGGKKGEIKRGSIDPTDGP